MGTKEQAEMKITFKTGEGHKVGFGHRSRCQGIADAIEDLGGTVVWNQLDTKTICIDVPGWTDMPDAEKVMLLDNRDADRDKADHVIYPTFYWELDQWDYDNGSKVKAGPEWIPLSKRCMEAGQRRTRNYDCGAVFLDGNTKRICSLESRHQGPHSTVSAPFPPKKDIDLLITFGGTDQEEMTERVQRALHVGACTALRHLKTIAVSIGPYMQEREHAIKSRAHLTCSGDELYGFMARARCAITHIGHTMNELAYHRVPTMLLARKRWDAKAIAYYRNNGPFIPIGLNLDMTDDELSAALETYIPVALNMRRTDKVPGLGKGSERLARLLLA